MLPEITVLMSVYNEERYVSEAIASILSQTFKDFEFVIIDDASTDSTSKIIESFWKKDKRIKIHRNTENLRLAASLNVGLSLAQSPLVARMDADDVAMPQRLQKQHDYMRGHPEISVCGTSIEVYEQRGKYWIPPRTHEAICARMVFENCLFHATAIYRKDIVLRLSQPGYDPTQSDAEDYDLWHRLGEVPTIRFANILEPLYRCRTYPQIGRWEYRKNSRILVGRIRRRYLAKLGLYPDIKSFSCHEAISDRTRVESLPALKDCHEWIDRLAEANSRLNIYETDRMTNELRMRWKSICLRSSNGNPITVITYIKSRWTPWFGESFFNALHMLWRIIKFRWM